MAKKARSKRSSATKVPARGKRSAGTAKARKASTRRAATKPARPKAKGAKGQPRASTTSSHRGAGKAKKPAQTDAGGEGGGIDPSGAKRGGATGRKAKTPGASAAALRMEVRNVNVPGYRSTVDATKYEAMRATVFSFLPREPPGLTQAEMMERARANAPRDVFPGGDTSEWWMKTVQLDQEARGAIKRSQTKPLRWWRAI